MNTVNLIMPKLGLTMTDGTITAIHYKEGDFIKAGEPIIEFETNKLTDQITAPADGYIVKILVQEGDEVECGKPVCIFSTQS